MEIPVAGPSYAGPPTDLQFEGFPQSQQRFNMTDPSAMAFAAHFPTITSDDTANEERWAETTATGLSMSNDENVFKILSTNSTVRPRVIRVKPVFVSNQMVSARFFPRFFTRLSQ